MNYALLGQVKSWIAPGLGDCNDEKLTRAANLIRRYFYDWYQELSLFLDAVECYRVQRLRVRCNDCHDTYLGVTLPRGVQQVEAMWWNDLPVALQSSWREFQVGLSPECDCRLQKYDMPGNFPTAVDLAAPSKLLVRCFNEADVGTRFVIRGRADTGQPVIEQFALSMETQETSLAFLSIEQVIKSTTAGRVALADSSGHQLSLYEPDETVPTYKRIKITGLFDGCDAVNIRASRRYYPLVGDDDVVETDNEVAFDAMARYLRIYERADKTSADIATSKDYYLTAFKMMMGDKAREHGKATQAEVRFASPSLAGRGLNRFGGTRGW